MALVKQLPTKVYKLGALTLGSGLQGNRWIEQPFTNLPDFIQATQSRAGRTVPNKACVVELEYKLTATFTTNASDPALYSYFLHLMLDHEIVGPGGVTIVSRKGWHDPLWSILQNGRVFGNWPQDLPATGAGGAGAYVRTITKHIRFVDENMSSSLARVIPAAALARSGRIRFYLHTGPEVVKGVTLGVSAATLEIFAHIIDVPADEVPIPAYVDERSIDSVRDPINFGPGPGTYLRAAIIQSPQYAGTADDLSLITNIDSFGAPGNLVKVDEPTDVSIRRFELEIVDPIEPKPPAPPVSTNKLEFRAASPSASADGRTRMLPLIYPRRGQDISDAPRFESNPTLKVNNTAVVPYTSVDFLVQRVMPRSQAMLNAYLTALGAKDTPRFTSGYLQRDGSIKPGLRPGLLPLVVRTV